MKRAFIIAFAFLYLLSAAGIALNLHYCGGKIQSISFHHTDESDCCKGKMKKAGCCKETSAYVKIEDNQVQSSGLQLPACKSCELFTATCAIDLSANQAAIRAMIPADHGPPIACKAPPYLRHRVLLI